VAVEIVELEIGKANQQHNKKNKKLDEPRKERKRENTEY
jgi:hypothetical protein